MKTEPIKDGILRCNCTHKAQDQLHGAGMRVHTPKNKTSPGWWR